MRKYFRLRGERKWGYGAACLVAFLIATNFMTMIVTNAIAKDVAEPVSSLHGSCVLPSQVTKQKLEDWFNALTEALNHQDAEGLFNVLAPGQKQFGLFNEKVLKIKSALGTSLTERVGKIVGGNWAGFQLAGEQNGLEVFQANYLLELDQSQVKSGTPSTGSLSLQIAYDGKEVGLIGAYPNFRFSAASQK